MSSPKVTMTPVARQVPFDNSSNGFQSNTTQGAIEEIGASASPGFSFGRSGTSNAGTYLQVDGVPSNQAGRVVPLSSAYLSDIFISCQSAATFSVEIQKRVGNTFTTIYTQSVTSSRIFTGSITGVPVNLGDELCCKVGSGSVSNIVVGVIVRGGT